MTLEIDAYPQCPTCDSALLVNKLGGCGGATYICYGCDGKFDA